MEIESKHKKMGRKKEKRKARSNDMP